MRLNGFSARRRCARVAARGVFALPTIAQSPSAPAATTGWISHVGHSVQRWTRARRQRGGF
eukprot:6715078-Pyramimonas_sp.AAC.1